MDRFSPLYRRGKIEYNNLYVRCRSGGTGRRAVFRAQCPCGRAGSNPAFGTKKDNVNLRCMTGVFCLGLFLIAVVHPSIYLSPPREKRAVVLRGFLEVWLHFDTSGLSSFINSKCLKKECLLIYRNT